MEIVLHQRRFYLTSPCLQACFQDTCCIGKLYGKKRGRSVTIKAQICNINLESASKAGHLWSKNNTCDGQSNPGPEKYLLCWSEGQRRAISGTINCQYHPAALWLPLDLWCSHVQRYLSTSLPRPLSKAIVSQSFCCKVKCSYRAKKPSIYHLSTFNGAWMKSYWNRSFALSVISWNDDNCTLFVSLKCGSLALSCLISEIWAIKYENKFISVCSFSR